MVAFAAPRLRKGPCFLFLLLFTFFFLSPGLCKSNEFLVGTDPRGSFSHFAGKWICHTLKTYGKEVSCKVIPAAPTSNLVNLNNGALDIALVNSKVIYDGQVKQGAFQYIDIMLDDLRLLLPFYRIPVTAIVKNTVAIQSIDDLPGKRINIGSPNSTKNLIFREIMTTKGWSRKSFATLENLSSRHSQDIISFKRGSIQALLHLGMHPDPRFERVLSNKMSKLIPFAGPELEALARSKSGFCLTELQPGIYGGYYEKMQTLAMEVLLITSSDMDDNTVSWILEGIIAARKKLQQAHPAFLNMKIDIETLNEGYLHPHPEALLYFQENLHRLKDN